MKEDILEQLVEDWLQSKGYFTRANLKFKPSEDQDGFIKQKDNQPSDIDVVGFHPILLGAESVMVVGCKSWQDGFEIRKTADALNNNPNRKLGNKEAWKHFRELAVEKWAQAFVRAIKESTGSSVFTYVTAVTTATDLDNKPLWENNPKFKQALRGNPVRLVTLQDMLTEVFTKLGTTVESSQFSRTLQLIKAAGLSVTLISR